MMKMKDCGMHWTRPESGMWGERYLDRHAVLLSDERTEAEMAVLLRHLGPGPKRVLDAPCGFGRFANRLARAGHDVTGIDLDPTFLGVARADARERGVRVRYVCGDLAEFDEFGAFDAVLNLCTSIGYLDSDEENEAFIARLCSFVRPGGLLVVETVNPHRIATSHVAREEHTTRSGATVISETSFDPLTAVFHEAVEYRSPDRAAFWGEARVRLYFPHELRRLVGSRGFRLVAHCDHSGDAFRLDSASMWLVFARDA